MTHHTARHPRTARRTEMVLRQDAHGVSQGVSRSRGRYVASRGCGMRSVAPARAALHPVTPGSTTLPLICSLFYTSHLPRGQTCRRILHGACNPSG